MKKKINVEVGRLCKSLKGHDAGSIYMIYKTEGEFVWLVDGDYKKIDKPKKKRTKHISLIDQVLKNIAAKITEQKVVYSEEIYSAIKKFKEETGNQRRENG